MNFRNLTTRSLITVATLCLSATASAAPITYSVAHTFDSFDFGSYTGSAWTVTGSITTNGDIARPGDAVGSEPGHLVQYNNSFGDFVAYDITVANAVEGISYNFATNTPETVTDDNQGFGNWHSLPTDLWADSTGSLMLQFIGLRDTTNHPSGAYFVWTSSLLYLYDYALGGGQYLFGDQTHYAFANNSYTQEFATVDTNVPISGTLGLSLLGLAALRRRSSFRR